MRCPTTENLLAFGRGLLRGDEATALQGHLDECPSCRVLVAEAVASVDEGVSQPPAALSSSFLGRGDVLGRYVVMERIGAGGMGVVYAARDPELHRKVALKILRFDTVQPARLAESQARLLREAQATARVVHPNVVAIHDFGRVDERVFLAMEFVEGTTLGARLRAGRMPWREVLGLFLQAGQGLAAAHAAGLVHRDFKPDNVLIDTTGRVRITDFGLVRILDGAEESPPSAVAAAPVVEGESNDSLTQTGTLLGTPGYMAPEQSRGETPDARSDQFSFCVALYEALYGARPFPRAASAELALEQGARAARTLQREARVPDRIHLAVLKGLSPEPEDRHASMEVLLRALGQEPLLSPHQLLHVAGIAAALLAVGVVAFFATRPTLCEDDPRALAGVWDEKTRTSVRDALLKTGLPYAADTWRGVSGSLDVYARDWMAASRHACEVTRIHGRQTEGMYERQLLCLEQRRREVSALVGVLSTVAAPVAQNAVRAVSGLEDLGRCSDVQALTSSRPLPKDPGVREKLESLQKDIATVRARLHAGQPKSALELASTLPARMEGMDFPPVHVEMLRVLAQSQAESHEKEAVQTLHKLIQTAQAAGMDWHVADGWVSLLRVASFLDKGADPEDQYGSHATAAVQRLGGDAPMEVTLATNLSSLLQSKGKNPEALAEGLHALELARKTYPPKDARLSTPLLNAGRMLGIAGRFDEAVALLREAHERYVANYGPDHPDVGVVLSLLAVQETYLNRYEDAVAHQTRVLAIYAAVHGAESLNVASALHNMGNMLSHVAGRNEDAAEHFRRAVALREKLLGPEDARVASSLSGLGQVLRALGRPTEALAAHERALAIREKAKGPDSLEAAYDRGLVGESLMSLKQPRKARPFVERALAVYEKKSFGTDELILADIRFLLARTLEGEPHEKARARKLALSSLEIYRRFPKAREKEIPEVETWLAAR
ncbi:serine/threonine protein kinase [Myxococcus stipitatus DSM 14675]|uniref:Serine/threonine protein kinase n=1 Tax=Myxococcus stipitatus (strain DSM 14675 / JCM 12634 / Mx s8) TaxID=1278073 RepID=L7UHY5_MYXSD|nr:serine/threonine-protein kinase [Myxococcus stipitatus]AGC48586.1 serine/threonine protein kinase [Myxococcus stipitatus DSM 14675]